MGRHSNRAPSVAESMAEYFDASEVIVCESSSEAEASDESGLSDITTTSTSEPEEGHGESFSSQLHHIAHIAIHVSPDSCQYWTITPACDLHDTNDHFLPSSTAAATLNYRTSLNNAPDQPSPVPTNTGTISLMFCNLKSLISTHAQSGSAMNCLTPAPMRLEVLVHLLY